MPMSSFRKLWSRTMDKIDQLLAGEFDRITVQPDGQVVLSAPPPPLLFPGSFNPLHEDMRCWHESPRNSGSSR